MIHVSGAGNFSDGGKTGSFNPESKHWNDADKNDIKRISSSMKNGGPDKIILEADAAGIVDGFIVCPVGIHGLAETGIRSSSRGVIITKMVENALRLGYSPYVGDGTAVFQMVCSK